MTRRAFLERMALLAAGLAVDPERLLWTPKSMITVPHTYGAWDLASGPDWTVVRMIADYDMRILVNLGIPAQRFMRVRVVGGGKVVVEERDRP